MFNKGDRIKIQNDSILNDIMQLGPIVTGTVFTLSPDGRVIGFKCDQTGAIEGVDDGVITKL